MVPVTMCKKNGDNAERFLRNDDSDEPLCVEYQRRAGVVGLGDKQRAQHLPFMATLRDDHLRCSTQRLMNLKASRARACTCHVM